MSAGVLGLVLLAAVFHAAWNIAAKRADGYGRVFVWAYGLAGALLLTAPAGWIIATTPGALSWPVVAAGIVTGALHVGYGLCLQTGYAKADLSIVYPVARGAGPVLTMAVAIAVLGERPGWLAVAGAAAIVGGIALLIARRPAGGARVGPGLVWGLATAAFIAAYTLFDGHAVNAWAPHPVVYLWLSGVVQALLLTPSALRRRELVAALVRLRGATVVLVGLLSSTAYLLVLVAMQRAPISLVAPLRETSVVIGLVLARLLFREQSLGARMAGAAVVVAGTALIALG